MNHRRLYGTLLGALTAGLLTAAILGQSALGIPVGGPPVPTTTFVGTPTPTGTKIVNNGSALCLWANGGSSGVTQTACSGQISLPALQQVEWNVVAAGSGTVLFRGNTIVPFIHVVNVFTGQCLNDVNSSSNSGAATNVAPCSSSTAMAWTLGLRSGDNDVQLVNAASGGCLQPSQASHTRGTAVVQDPCVGSGSGDPTQFWSGVG